MQESWNDNSNMSKQIASFFLFLHIWFWLFLGLVFVPQGFFFPLPPVIYPVLQCSMLLLFVFACKHILYCKNIKTN